MTPLGSFFLFKTDCYSFSYTKPVCILLDLYSTILGVGVIVNKISFLNFKLQFSLLVYNKATEFYILITHLQLLYTSRRF